MARQRAKRIVQRPFNVPIITLMPPAPANSSRPKATGRTAPWAVRQPASMSSIATTHICCCDKELAIELTFFVCRFFEDAYYEVLSRMVSYVHLRVSFCQSLAHGMIFWTQFCVVLCCCCRRRCRCFTLIFLPFLWFIIIIIFCP